MSKTKSKTNKQTKLTLEHFGYLAKMLTEDQFARLTSHVPLEAGHQEPNKNNKAKYASEFLMHGFNSYPIKDVSSEEILKIREDLKDFDCMHAFKAAIKPSKLAEIYNTLGFFNFPKRDQLLDRDLNFKNYSEENRQNCFKERDFAKQQISVFTALLGKDVYRKKLGTLKLHPAKTHLLKKKTYPDEEYYGHKTLNFSCLAGDGVSAMDPTSLDHAYWLSHNGFKVCHYAQDVTTRATRAARAAYGSLELKVDKLRLLGKETQTVLEKINLARKSCSSRTIEDVSGLQFYVFDFDSEISLEEIFKRFGELGLTNAIRVVVQTSPNKFHVYIEHDYTHSWEENYSYNLGYYKQLAGILGADTQACLATGIYQSPGFVNPKSGYFSHICYANKNSRIVSLLDIFSIIRSLLDRAEAADAALQKQLPASEPKASANLEKNDVPTEDILNSSSPLTSYLNFISNFDQKSCSELWGIYNSKNLTGKRNETLLKLFRFFHLIFDITNPSICRQICDKIVYPFFDGCFSGSLTGHENQKKLERQVNSLFETNKRKVEKGHLNQPRRSLNRESISFFEKIFEANLQIWKKEGHLQGVGRPTSIIKALYARLDLTSAKCAYKRESNGILFVEAFTPVEEIKKIFRHHYRYKNFLERIYITNGKIRFPLFQLSGFYRFAANKGCGYSKHFLIAIPVSKDFWLELAEKPLEAETLYDKKIITFEDMLTKICEKKVYSFFSANKPRTLRPRRAKNPTGPPPFARAA